MNSERFFIHISDIHYRLNWEENQENVLQAFFKDLQIQVQKLGVENVYLILSGDVVLAGGKEELYLKFMEDFSSELDKIGIGKNNRICIPGNHDVSVPFIEKNFVDHNGILIQNLDEKNFNDYIFHNTGPIVDKFTNYRKFEKQFCDFGLGINIGGQGWLLDQQLGVYCLNTALLSSGGFKNINDKEKLVVDTRNLHKWLKESESLTRILVMHHPLDWLSEWAKVALKEIIRNNFALVVSGHVHDQDIFHSIQKKGALVECSAPPLFTNKKDRLGYTIISVTNAGTSKVIYRQWTGKGAFVRGVNFTNDEDGIIEIVPRASRREEKIAAKSEKSLEISFFLKKRLDNALKAFSTQPIVWIDPVISKNAYSDFHPMNDDSSNVSLSEIIEDNSPVIIKAPTQFGLTCLAHFLIKEAWNLKEKVWIYIDYKETKLHGVDKAIANELKEFSVDPSQLDCIVLDSWIASEKDALKFIKKIQTMHPKVRLLIMRTSEEKSLGQKMDNLDPEGFKILHLLPLPRTQIRKVVNDYNQLLPIGDEDSVLHKIVTDLEVLNIHRTPLNCLTLLKVLENNFDDSPVNRAELIHSILYLLFQVDKIPTYKSKPDLKDCEFVLGALCEEIVRGITPSIFSRDTFIKKLNGFCNERVIELEVSLVFGILFDNNIIVKRENGFSFRFVYWVYYFAAVRMRNNKAFADYIFEKMRYASFPEIVELYTGSDRSRNDALEILIKDLKEINEAVDKKVGLPENMNPYKTMTWNPSEVVLERLNSEISEDVHNSKLPDVIKDRYEDRTYNPNKPFNQSIRAIFEDYSLALLWEATKAAARALRNSDYAEPEPKRELLQQITASWKHISKVLFAISPILAEKGAASFDGTGFVLIDEFPDDPHRKWLTVICEVSSNIVGWFKNDIASQKMGPLLYDNLTKESDELKRHQIALLILVERPKNWKSAIQAYIESLHKNSYFLYDLNNALQQQYMYAFASNNDVRDMKQLIKAAISKHNFGTTSKTKHVTDDMIGKREQDQENQ